MPDCSYVSVEIDLGDTGLDGYTIEAVGKAVIDAGQSDDAWQFLPTIGETIEPADGTFMSEEDDCPWGWSQRDDDAMIAKAIGLGVQRIRIFDGGHYTWDPSEEVWIAGRGLRFRSRPTGQEGQVYVDAYRIRQVIDQAHENFSGSEIAWMVVDALEGMIGDNPQYW